MISRKPIEFDDLLWRGLDLLGNFIAELKPNGKSPREVIDWFVKALGNYYIPLVSVGTATKTTISDTWTENRKEELSKWLSDFITRYEFSIKCFDDLSLDYRARVALSLLLILAKDLIENKRVMLKERSGWVFEKSIVSWLDTSLTLDVLVGYVYPIVMNLISSGAISQGTEPVGIISQVNDDVRRLYEATKERGKSKVGGGTAYRIYQVLYLPLTSIGAIAEFSSDVMGITGQKYRFFVTGYGHMLNNLMKTALANSLNPVHYEAILNSLIALSHVHQEIVRNYIISTQYNLYDNLLPGFINSIIRTSINEYRNCMMHIPNEIIDYYYYSFTDALQDVMSMAWLAFSQFIELEGMVKDRKIDEAVFSKFRNYINIPDIEWVKRKLILTLWAGRAEA